MTIDEAIKHAEEVAMLNENTCKAKPNLDLKMHRECAEEHRQLAEWLKELKKLREQTRWISVDELLPEGSGNVLVTDGEDVFIGWRLDGKWHSDNYDYYEFSHPIIAWMPLPEPYKTESEEATERFKDKLENGYFRERREV